MQIEEICIIVITVYWTYVHIRVTSNKLSMPNTKVLKDHGMMKYRGRGELVV